ncbi:hypothetical protein [Prosthecobacter sp.]|uniref:hypothetical protein n=1 Tax=Prosthecobacter sp. TaxID=1965333 RepID=UPI0037849A18
MKKIITLLAIMTGFAVVAPTASEARDHHDHGGSFTSFSHRCGACGTSVYRQRVIIGRDRHGHLVYGWRTVSHNCRPAHHHDHGHSSGGRFGFPGFGMNSGGHGRH